MMLVAFALLRKKLELRAKGKSDHVPADGVVKVWQSTVNDSRRAEIAIGSMHFNDKIGIEVRNHGDETAMASTVPLVEEAQTWEAHVQRLAVKLRSRSLYLAGSDCEN